MALSGVRSSWDMLARNSDLCRFATSTSRLFSSSWRKRRAFWMASADWVAKVWSSSTTSGGNSPGVFRFTTRPPTRWSSRSRGTASTARAPERTQDVAEPAVVGALDRDVGDLGGLVGDRHAPGGALALPEPDAPPQLEVLIVEVVRWRGARTPRPPRRTRRWSRRRRPQSWTARETMVVSTVSRSSVELTARPTSPSAVSCPTERVSSAVRACSSLRRRAFSMAMTAWSAKVWTSSIWASENGPGASRRSASTPIGLTAAEDRHRELAAEAEPLFTLAQAGGSSRDPRRPARGRLSPRRRPDP